jgi:hypothetical protein
VAQARFARAVAADRKVRDAFARYSSANVIVTPAESSVWPGAIGTDAAIA